jgi:heat shock protein HslJ
MRDGAPLSLVANSQIRIGFNRGQLNASAGCNSIGGSYVLQGGVLIAQQLGMTEMACTPSALMDQESWFVDVLTSGPTLTLEGDSLTITSGSTVIALLDREVAEPNAQLVGPLWTVASLITGDTVSSVPQGASATLQFDAAGNVAIDTGCNTGSADYAVDADTLTFSSFSLTKKACSGPAGVLEQAVLTAIDAGPVHYAIDAQSLTFSAGMAGLQLTAH